MERSTPQELMNDIQEAKNILKDLGRRVFRISSTLNELNEEEKSFLREFREQHDLFEKEAVIHTRLDEIYKASVGYVELLKDVNIHLLEVTGRPRPE